MDADTPISAANALVLRDSRTFVRVSEGTRTPDRLDHNQELYQLSYAHRVGASIYQRDVISLQRPRPDPSLTHDSDAPEALCSSRRYGLCVRIEAVGRRPLPVEKIDTHGGAISPGSIPPLRPVAADASLDPLHVGPDPPDAADHRWQFRARHRELVGGGR